MPGISDSWWKSALLELKLSTYSAVFRCQGGKGDDPLASSQLFRGSCNIYLVLWYLAHESKSFFDVFLMSIFPTPLRSFQPSSTFLSDAFRSRSSPESLCSCLHLLSWAFCLHPCWINFISLCNLWSFKFSSLFMLLVTHPTFRLLAQLNYCEMLLLSDCFLNRNTDRRLSPASKNTSS